MRTRGAAQRQLAAPPGADGARRRRGVRSILALPNSGLLMVAATAAHLLTMPLSTFSRDVVPFDYAWRFRTVLPAPLPAPPPPPWRKACPEFNTTSSATCSGLGATPAGNSSAALCKQQCCNNAECYVWQYSLAPASDRCWTGQCKSPGPDVPTWVSQAAPVPSKPQPAPPPPRPPENSCAYCGVEVNDSDWELIDAPHDFIITQPISKTENNGAGSFHRVDGVYRKHFTLPGTWRGDHVALRFEGVYKSAQVWINGRTVKSYGGSAGRGGWSAEAYTEFEVRLDNLTNLVFDGTISNVVAIYVNGEPGNEHWYTGAGLYRSVHLIHSKLLHIDPLSSYFPSVEVSTSERVAGDASASTAIVQPQVGLVNHARIAMTVDVVARVLDAEEKLVGTASHTATAASRSENVIVRLPAITIISPHLWGIQSPYLYTVVTDVLDASSRQVLDSVNTTIGVRSIRWDYDHGFFLNGKNIKLRGFCHHDSFTGVGMAMPDRVWLLRAQQSRGVGANAWRMSHNNYRESVYSLADAMGTVVWDENRDLREMGLAAMNKMVRAHRHHASVAVWSLCNEGECDFGMNKTTHRRLVNNTIYSQFRNLTKELDPHRAVSGNMFAEYGPGTLTDFLDLQGLSHPPTFEITGSHKANLPTRRPQITSECCSCESQRGEDVGSASQHLAPLPNATESQRQYSGFNADCLQDTVNRSDHARMDYVSGLFIWTLGDYLGEPAPIGWPHVSSSFGAVDLAGIPKAGARWFQAWWLYSADGPLWEASRPPLPAGEMVHIVEKAEWPADLALHRTVHVYSSAPSVELQLSGTSLGVRQNSEWLGWTEWNITRQQLPTSGVTTLKALARNQSGAVVATHSRVAPSIATHIVLSIDAPSPTTGTGQRVVLDGHDVALVRATIVDSSGFPVGHASDNITFTVLSGKGRILGVGNGDPGCREPHHATWRSAYNGLARAIVKVTEDASSSPATRALLQEIDVESGRSTVSIADPALPVAPQQPPIVVRASAPGLSSGTIAVEVSTDAATDGVLAAAKASLRVPISLE